MAAAVLANLSGTDALIMAAAVADYRPEQMTEQKIKKEMQGVLTLRLVQNPDILAEVAAARQDTRRPVVVGFAAETQDLIDNAVAKLQKKKLDMIVANDITAAGSGFEVDTNQVTLITQDGQIEKLPLMSKLEAAYEILDRVVARLKEPQL
jgi:phosphopantothenoylcysteine decarboxylase/phosphopantothenate--cysteine ligase